MGFSAEMKDFLLAYKTGQDINASRTNQDYVEARGQYTKERSARENDPETIALAKDRARATLAITQDRMRNNAASRGVAGTRRQLLQEKLRQLRGLDSAGSGLLPTGGSVLQSTMNTGVLPVAPVSIDTGEDMYAEGGLVEDDELDSGGLDSGGFDSGGSEGLLAAAEDESVLDTSPTPLTRTAAMTPPAAPSYAPPTGAAPATPAATPIASRTRGIEGIIAPALVEDARRQGMKFGIEKSGLNRSGAIRSPSQRLKAKQIAAGMGGLSEPEMQAARQAVDPEGKLTDSQRNVAALGSVYQFWANKGEPEKAQRVAFQMLQYYRGASQRYAALAAKAAEGGNMDLATKAALKAYANVPDGRDLELSPNPDGGLLYSYTDEKGDVIAKGVATPQQLVSSAMGLATGGFDRALLAAAGASPDTGAVKTSGGGRTQTASDRAKETESVVGEIDKMKVAWQEKNKDTPVNEEQWNEVANVAQHIYQQNPKSTPNEVARAAHAMLNMGADPEKPGFKVKPGEEGSPNVVDFGGGRSIKLDDEQLESILNSRAVKVKAATDEINKKMEESDKPGFLDAAGTAAKNIGAIAIDELTPPEPIRKAAGAVGSRIMDAAGAIADSDAKINVGTATTAMKNTILKAARAIKGLSDVSEHADENEKK